MKKSLITVSAVFLILASCASPKKYSWRYKGKTESQARQEEAECQLMAKQARNESRGDPYWGDKGGTNVYEHEGTYNRYSRTYSGETTATNEPDYLGIMFDEFAKNTDAQEVYELCMRSKGFYEVNTLNPPEESKQANVPPVTKKSSGQTKPYLNNKKTSNKYRSPGGEGSPCKFGKECKDGFFCSQTKGTCQPITGYKKKFVPKKRIGDHCSKTTDCDLNLICNEMGFCENIDSFIEKNSKNRKLETVGSYCSKHTDCKEDGTLCDQEINICIESVEWSKKYKNNDEKIVTKESSNEPITSEETKLTKLKNLYDNGLITKEEYDKKRKEILDAM